MNGHEKTDGLVVPAKLPNKTGVPVAEAVEGSSPAEGSTDSTTRPGRSAGQGVSSGLDRVREVAQKDKDVRFTALLHHVDLSRLWAAYVAINPKASPGVDKVTWETYGQDLRANLEDLRKRVHSGAYRASPSRRVYIPKPDGRLRPLGIATLEDKIVQRAVIEVLNAIYEEDFLGFSYGFRPGRKPHDALDALSVGISRKKVNWVLDADISDFFSKLDQAWLMKFLEHRIADKRLLRLIQKWLSAGVIENGKWSDSLEGTPQGGSASPLLANVYLHYVFDRWVRQWRLTHARGDMIVTVLPTTSWSGSSTLVRQSGSSKTFESGLRSSTWSCTRTRPGSSSSAALRLRTEKSGASQSQRHSISWALLISAERPRTGASGSGASPSKSGCGRS